MKYMNPFILFIVPHPWCQFRLFHDVTSPFLCFFLVCVSPYGSLWIYDGITWFPRRPSSPPVNLVSAVADAWQEIRRFFLNDLVTLVREQQTVLTVKGQNQNPKRLRFSFLHFNMQDLQKFIEDWDVIRGKGGGLFEKEHANKKPKEWKKESPNPQRISRTQIRRTFRGSAAGFQLSALVTNHGFAVQMTSRHPWIISYHWSPDPWETEMAGAKTIQNFRPFKRGGHRSRSNTARIWGRLETTSTWNTYKIGPEVQRLEPTMSQRSRATPHANTNFGVIFISCQGQRRPKPILDYIQRTLHLSGHVFINASHCQGPKKNNAWISIPLPFTSAWKSSV